MIKQIVRMLCAGLIHGDLSSSTYARRRWPVIIDLPQAVDAAGNNNAFAMLERDVNNMRATFGDLRPSCSRRSTRAKSGRCMRPRMTPIAVLTGRFAAIRRRRMWMPYSPRSRMSGEAEERHAGESRWTPLEDNSRSFVQTRSPMQLSLAFRLAFTHRRREPQEA